MERSRNDWLAEAHGVGEYLRDRARPAAGGAAVWLKPSGPEDTERAPLALGPYLYTGSTGISLFLAALGHSLRDDGWRDLARQSLVPIRRHLRALIASPSAAGRTPLKLGGLVGLGALLYSFARIGVWLDEPALLEEALGLVALITPERIENDLYLDLMYGSAGAILGLLVLDREAAKLWPGEERPLERAVACGEHLLRRRVAAPGEPRAWPFRGGPPRCGLAHGAAGILYALALLADRTEREDFRQAAREGLEFERLLYAPEEQNWRPSPAQEGPTLAAWCNGAPGIALSRLRLAGTSTADGEIEEELVHALAKTRGIEESQIDFLCCGNMGRADILLDAARELGRDDLLARAQEVAARVAGRTAFRDAPPDDPDYRPSFFRGAAGIGYAFLRLAEPSLPSVLILE
ncbi:MAG TPA: lanthionine synthetase LanC family protein [Thermoanaerobaculia bacterium]